MKLDLSGDFEVQASPAAAYAFLMDPHRMAPLLPMFKELSAVHDEGFTGSAGTRARGSGGQASGVHSGSAR
jgi:carbon monoxide dehydrogenase subunit G